MHYQLNFRIGNVRRRFLRIVNSGSLSRFSLQLGPFRLAIWAISGAEMGHIGPRYGSFRNPIWVTLQHVESQHDGQTVYFQFLSSPFSFSNCVTLLIIVAALNILQHPPNIFGTLPEVSHFLPFFWQLQILFVPLQPNCSTTRQKKQNCSTTRQIKQISKTIMKKTFLLKALMTMLLLAVGMKTSQL